MTIGLLGDYGIHIMSSGYSTFTIPGNQQHQLDEYQVEGDWSAASFLLAAGAIAGTVRLTGLDTCSAQADRLFLEALDAAGAQVIVDEQAIQVTQQRLTAFTFDATSCPDLFPPLVALACQCEGTTRLKGVKRLQYKESDRAAVLLKEFTNLGVHMKIDGDWMAVTNSKLTGGIIQSHGDHRIAMAGAVAALRAEGQVMIEGSECVAKSYPGFFQDIASIGGKIDE